MAAVPIQSSAELDAFYTTLDPWNYDTTEDDQLRKRELLSLLPRRTYRRTLDIGCGNGFMTVDLPGDIVLGVDLSPRAIKWARQRVAGDRIRFDAVSLFDLTPARQGTFDLIVITDVLYPHHIGKGAPLVRVLVDDLLHHGGVLASCHVTSRHLMRFPYCVLDTVVYPYREHTHRLEVYQK